MKTGRPLAKRRRQLGSKQFYFCYHCDILSQNLRLSKQLESAGVDRQDEVRRLETRVQELAGELALATEAKTRLEMQCEESRQRAALDADEQSSQLQQQLQVSCVIVFGFITLLIV